MTGTLVRVALLSILLGTSSRAQGYPAFEATKRVRTLPVEYVPPIFGAAGIARLEAALAQLPHPFYVLLAETLPPGPGDEDERASALVDGLAAEWTKQGMDPAETSLFVMTFEPRKFSLLAGARWKTQLGLEGARLDPYIEWFLDRVRGTPPDPVGGITEMAKRLEEHIFDQTDPERIAAREALVRERERENRLYRARDDLGNQIGRGNRLVHRAEELPDPPALEPFKQRIEAARELLTSKDEVEVGRASLALYNDIEPLSGWVEQASAAAAERRQTLIIAVLAGSLVVLFGIIFFAIRRGQLGRRRKAFAALADTWDDRIENAAGRYVEFYGKRDGILGLLELEGKTAALLNSVTGEVDAIYSSVAAMEAHIKEVDERARAARWFRLKPIDDALARIEAPFDFDTGVLNEADLFGPPTKQLRIDPTKLVEELEQRFASSQAGWKRLETAAELRFQEAVALLPHTLLDALLAKAAEHRLPSRWLADHPLFGDEAADMTVWQAADQWRWKDAIAFLEAIEQLRARHDAASARLDRLVAVRAGVGEVYIAALEPIAEAGATIYDAADDPADTIEIARATEAELEQAFLAAGDLELVERLGGETVALYRKTAEQRAKIVEALARAAPEIEAVHRLRVMSLERLREAAKQAEKAARIHVGSRAAGFVGAAQRRAEAGAAELGQSEAKLGARRHLDAQRAADVARTSFLTVREEAERALAHVDQLEAVRATYESRVAALPEKRQQKLVELRRYDHSSSLDEWVAPKISGPADYAELTKVLDAVIERWADRVRHAKLAWEEAERRRREAEEAARIARMRAEAARRSSSSSWSSSSSSSRSFSSFSSSSRSHSSSRSGSYGGGRSSSRSGSW